MMGFRAWLESQFAETPGIQAKEIAAMAELSPGYLSGLRSGAKQNPSAQVAGAVARAFAKARNLDPEEAHDLVLAAMAAAKELSDAKPPRGARALKVGPSLRGWPALLQSGATPSG